MKKLLTYMVLLIAVLLMTGCTTKDTTDKANQEQSQPHTLEALEKMPEFTLKDLEGNEVSNAVFADSKLTIINIWGTFCGPCIDEMPELQALNQEMKDQGVQVLGIVSDGITNEKLARQITKEQNSDYTNLIPNKKFMDEFVTRTNVVPVSILVNSKGERIGEVIVGARSLKQYREIAKTNLAAIQ